MGAAAAPIAIVSTLASAGMTAYGAYEQGQGTNAADQYQAQRLERAAQYGRVAATQTSAQLTEKLNIALGNIDAVRAAGNIDPSSPTTAALRERTSYLSGRDSDIRVGNILSQASENDSGAAYLRQAGSFAATQGMVGAGASLLKGVGQTNWGSFGWGA